MKLATLYFTFLFCLSASSQDNGYIATYSYEFLISEEFLNKPNKTDTDKYLLKLDDKTKKAAKHIEIQLHIKGPESYAFLTPSMDIDNLSLKSAVVASGHRQPIYSNSKTEKVFRPNSESIFPKNSYIISHPSLTTEWTLSQEQKIINGYLCYKAIGVLSKTVNGKKKEFNSIAWYTPSIPLYFGPLGYGKLPGLIVQLTVIDKKYSLKSIKEVSEDMIEIIQPNDGEIVTNEEYQELVKKAIKRKI